VRGLEGWRVGKLETVLERYLNSACAGLYGLERQTVRGELEANLLERVREFQVMGCSRAKALERALEEFGSPGKVSRGMQEVYILPNLLKSGALAGMLAVGAYLALASSVAGVVPISLCDGGQMGRVLGGNTAQCPSVMAFLKLEDIRADFAKQGYTLTADHRSFALERAGKTLLDFRWANPQEALSSLSKTRYLNLNSLITFDNDTQEAQVPVRFDRLLNPTLELAGAELRPTSTYSGDSVDITIPVAWRIAYFVHQAIDPQMQNYGYGNSIRYGLQLPHFDPLEKTSTQLLRKVDFSPQRSFTQTLEHVGTPGKVYALAWIRKDLDLKRDPAKHLMNEFVETALATADARGTLKFSTYQSRLEFTDSLETFKQARGKKALLLELTGRLDNAAPAFTVVQNPPPSSQSR